MQWFLKDFFQMFEHQWMHRQENYSLLLQLHCRQKDRKPKILRICYTVENGQLLKWTHFEGKMCKFTIMVTQRVHMINISALNIALGSCGTSSKLSERIPFSSFFLTYFIRINTEPFWLTNETQCPSLPPAQQDSGNTAPEVTLNPGHSAQLQTAVINQSSLDLVLLNYLAQDWSSEYRFVISLIYC